MTIRSPDRSLYLAALPAAFSDKTKLLLLNHPQIPASKVYSRAELEAIARMVKEFDPIAICDEVYEHTAFDGREHIPLMSLPGVRERTDRTDARGVQGASAPGIHHGAEPATLGGVRVAAR